MAGDNTLDALAATIASRRAADAGASYTKSLLDKGVAACAKKLGEEATEAVIAAVSETDDRLVSEAADVLYHLLVVLEARQIPLRDVNAELTRRMGQSGLAEKASRADRGTGPS
jgi:phosphoribosyl-ATP pyrophosphohydrolase